MLVLLLSILFLFTSPGSDIRDDLADYLSIHLKDYEKYEYDLIIDTNEMQKAEIKKLEDKERMRDYCNG